MTPEEIKRSRTMAGLSQSQLADRMCVSIKSLQGWEQGLNPMPVPMQKLMKYILIAP